MNLSEFILYPFSFLSFAWRKLFLQFISGKREKGKGKWKVERCFHFEPRRGEILIGRNINTLPHRARDGSGILLGNGAKRNEPKDTAHSPVNDGVAKRSHRAGARINNSP